MPTQAVTQLLSTTRHHLTQALQYHDHHKHILDQLENKEDQTTALPKEKNAQLRKLKAEYCTYVGDLRESIQHLQTLAEGLRNPTETLRTPQWAKILKTLSTQIKTGEDLRNRYTEFADELKDDTASAQVGYLGITAKQATIAFAVAVAGAGITFAVCVAATVSLA
jgi:hypothetical protein